MNCRNCLNFKPERKSNRQHAFMEAADELSPKFSNMECITGKCTIADKSCRETDICDCGGFVKRR